MQEINYKGGKWDGKKTYEELSPPREIIFGLSHCLASAEEKMKRSNFF